ncbi:MAG: Bug family tripartite tricarboxylate transporter substrate binding protein [Parashewanella sp.]
MNKFMISLLIITIGFSLTSLPSHASTDPFPNRSIKIIVPYKAGGGVDSYARAIAKTKIAGENSKFVIINRAGSAGLNGAVRILKSKADGYNLLLVSGSSLVLSSLSRQSVVDPLNSFEFIAQIGQLNTALMVPKSSPFHSVGDLLTAIKRDPKKYRWGHSGRGSFHHISGLGFLNANHIQLQDIPFKGGAPARAALISKQVDFAFIGLQQVKHFERHLRALAVNSANRDLVLRNIPTFDELNIPHFNLGSPVILLAPKATPKAIITKLTRTFAEISSNESFITALSKQGLAPLFKQPQQAKSELTQITTKVKPILLKRSLP